MKSLLNQKKFNGFFWTQFLGAFNDNAFKQAVVFMITFKLASTLPKEEADLYVSLGAGLFILPYVLFSTWAATWADRSGKSTVIVATKVLEIFIMSMGFVGFLILDPQAPRTALYLLMGVLFLMGTQSALFGPAKYGIIPEILTDKELTEGNGLIEMGTFVSILLGTFAGGELVKLFGDSPYFMSAVFITIAITGWWTSLRVPKTKAAAPDHPFRINVVSDIVHQFNAMRKNRVIYLTIIGISFFWFAGATFLQILPGFGSFVGANLTQTNFLMIFFSIGIGIGSVLCAPLSDGKVEIGLIPFGALGITLFSWIFGFDYPQNVSSWWDMVPTYFYLLGIGLFGGFFIVPLNALLQQRTTDQERASMIALNNIINALFMVLASVFVIVTRSILGMNEAHLVLATGFLLLVLTIYTCLLLPEFLLRFLLWILVNTIYRIKVLHRDRIPLEGPVLIVANHLSYIDAFMVQMSTHRQIRFIMAQDIFHVPVLRWFFKIMGAIPIYSRKHPEKLEAAFAAIQENLQRGEVVCIFPEGQISRTGQTFKFKPGMERILKEAPCPVVPIYLHGMWGSLFSFSDGKFFWKRPLSFPYPITVTVGEPMPADTSAANARNAVQELGAEAFAFRKSMQPLLHNQFILQAARYPWRTCLTDASGQRWNYRETCQHAKTLAHHFSKNFTEKNIGILLPSSVEAMVVNLAMAMAGKVAVNLNESFTDEQLNTILEECEIRTILTSEVYENRCQALNATHIEKVNLLTRPLSFPQRIQDALGLYFTPLRLQTIHNATTDDTLAIIYTVGTRGMPKGVKVSHYNLISNLEGFMELLLADSEERVVSLLPLYHAYGLAVTGWLPLLNGMRTTFLNPLASPEVVVQHIKKEKATFLVGTPDLLTHFTERIPSQTFRSLKYVISGGSALTENAVTKLEENFKTEILEGYGAAEAGPIIALNVPSVSVGRWEQTGQQPGSLGRALPGMAVQIRDQETGRLCELGEPGILWVKGPSVMQGYVTHRPETDALFQEGWFCTEDLVTLNEDGFLFLQTHAPEESTL